MPYSEDQLLPLSSVEHYKFCPRQCALMFIEQIWADNVFTAEGTVLHEKAHGGENESRGDIKIIRSMRLRSLRLGITGIADIIEFHRCQINEQGIILNDAFGKWIPFPVEYKRGAAKDIRSFSVQLCAQALCLEEMMVCHIPEGALFLGEKQHRTAVVFDDGLRAETEAACLAVHELFAAGITPSGEYSKRCQTCSLVASCLPQSAGSGKSAQRWLNRQLEEICSA